MLTSDRTEDGVLISRLTAGSDKKVELQCDSCGVRTITTYHNYTLAVKRNASTETNCRRCASQKSGKRRRGSSSWNKGIANKRGIESPTWRGGKYIDYHGYVMVHVNPTDDGQVRRGWQAYKKEHIVIIENALKRSLKKDEIVHHIDGDKQNNHIENLYLTDRIGHREAHQSLQEIGYMLLRLGFLRFDSTEGRYFVSEVLDPEIAAVASEAKMSKREIEEFKNKIDKIKEIER